MSAKKFFDKNQTLDPPSGFTLRSVYPSGSFLVVAYERTKSKDAVRISTECVSVFLNDQGREVGRLEYEIAEPPPQQQTVPSEPDPEFVVDWSGIGSSHIKAPNKFVAYLKLWWQCFCGVIKWRKS